jgi:hypothetical protein
MMLYKTIGICLLTIILNHESWSQQTISIGMNAGVRGERYDTRGRLGLGGSVEYVNHLTKLGGVRVYVGYDWFKNRLPKNIDEFTLRDSLARFPFAAHDLSFIPLRIGYQQFVFKDAAFVYAEAGISRYQTEYKWYEQKKNLFTYALGAGYRLSFQDQRHVQLSIYYNYYGMSEYIKHNYLNIRAAYGLTFRKRKG